MGGFTWTGARIAPESLVTWAVKPSASLADLATIDLRRITDVLQVDHASLFLRDPDDPQLAAVVAQTGLPVGEALPEHRLLLADVLQTGCAAEIQCPGGAGEPCSAALATPLLHGDRAVGAVLVVTRRREPAPGRHRRRRSSRGRRDAGRALPGPRDRRSPASLGPLRRATRPPRAADRRRAVPPAARPPGLVMPGRIRRPRFSVRPAAARLQTGRGGATARMTSPCPAGRAVRRRPVYGEPSSPVLSNRRAERSPYATTGAPTGPRPACMIRRDPLARRHCHRGRPVPVFPRVT